jgi:hypothetical protein
MKLRVDNNGIDFDVVLAFERRSQWPLELKHRANAGIVGSNPTQGMGVCVGLFCVCVLLCVGRGLATG